MSARAWPAAQPAVWRPRLGATGTSPLSLLLFVGTALVVRVATDHLASPDSRQSGSLQLSGAIAVMFIAVAIWLLLRRRRALVPTALAGLWLAAWTAVAVATHGASAETLREGVREMSVVALAAIVCNARGAIAGTTVGRIVQAMGLAPALVAIYQLATHSGMNVAGNIRANGTFAHPDSAAMFFAMATVVSMWLYLDKGRRRIDALGVGLFAVAMVATLSIAGLATLVAMLTVLGVLRPDRSRLQWIPYLLAAAVTSAFFLTPLGARRIVQQSSTKLTLANSHEVNTSLGWRLHKWELLLPEWESSPLIGRGLGTTTTTLPVRGDRYAGKPPHSEYVRYLVETGLLGLTILVVGAAILIRALFRKRLELRAGGSSNLATLALVLIAGCLVNALGDNTFLNSPTCYAVALVVAIALSAPSPLRTSQT